MSVVDKVTGVLEVGRNDRGEVIVNHPSLEMGENGVGHIVFSPDQARHLARLLDEHASKAQQEKQQAEELERQRVAEQIPVDRDCRVLTDGSPVTDDHREINPATGQQKGYVVLCETERAKGFVRPVRNAYKHVGRITDMVNDTNGMEWKQRLGGCGSVTTMGRALAETYARDPGFYSGTFCVTCRTHFPLNEFVWEGTEEQLGS